jgi:hypothetical protein
MTDKNKKPKQEVEQTEEKDVGAGGRLCEPVVESEEESDGA